MKKKILIIGSSQIFALEVIYRKHLTNLDNLVEIYPIQDIFLNFYNKNIFNKIIFRSGFSNIYKKIQHELLSFVNEFQPSHIIIFKGMEVLPSSLKIWKNEKIKIINYNPDNPFIFSGSGSGNKNVTNSISLFDLYVSYDKDIVQQLKLKNVNSILIPFGFDLEDFDFDQIIDEPEILRVCFVGNPDTERVNFIKQLSNYNIPIDLYGNGWGKYIQSNTIKIFPFIYGINFWKTLKKYAIQLNLMRIHNLDSHNMRSFEIPGVGGIMLAPKTKDHALYFKENVEVVLFENINDCVRKINFLLNCDVTKRALIRTNSRNISVKNYTYQNRVAQLNSALDNL
jgi:spore maturation protein CgeB